MTQAIDPSALKNPAIGRSKPETVISGVFCPCPGRMEAVGIIVIVSELSLKASRRLLSPLRAKYRAFWTGTVAVMAPLEMLNTTTPPGFPAGTGAEGAAA